MIPAILFLAAAGLVAGLWCAYDGISASVHAERALHSTRLTMQAVEEYLRKHDGAWPRSWTDLEQASTKIKEVYVWTEGSENVNKFVSIEFNADPDRLAKQTEDEFQAIKPVSPFYGSYRIEIPFLLEALRQTRRTKDVHVGHNEIPAK